MSIHIVVICNLSCVLLSDIQTTVRTTYGPIKGELTPLVRQFLSVPYAAPSDTTRWEPPQPHKGWTSVLDTTSIPPGCPQECISNIPNMYVISILFPICCVSTVSTLSVHDKVQ